MKHRLLEAKNIEGFKSGQTSSSMIWIKLLDQKALEFLGA